MIDSKLKGRGDYCPASLSPCAIKTRARAEAGSKKQHSYKPLPTRFRRDGFDYQQIARDGDAAIYEQRCTGCSNPSVSYEVVRVRRREGFQLTADLSNRRRFIQSRTFGAWTGSRSPIKTRDSRSCGR